MKYYIVPVGTVGVYLARPGELWEAQIDTNRVAVYTEEEIVYQEFKLSVPNFNTLPQKRKEQTYRSFRLPNGKLIAVPVNAILEVDSRKTVQTYLNI